MTEDEAKTKWCPFARVGFGPGDKSSATPNRDYEGVPTAATICLGSRCMAWRWARVANPDWKPTSQMAVFPQPNPHSDTNPQAVASATSGYCGLAGAQP